MVLSAQDTVLLTLLRRFVARQRLVMELIQSVRPHLLSREDSTTARPAKEVMSATARGDWGPLGEWCFHMHGSGCKMVHRLTGEPLDWQAPNIRRFDVYCFLAWVTWYWEQRDVDPEVKRLRSHLESAGIHAGLKDALTRLADLGLLQPARPLGTAYVLRTRVRRAAHR